MDVDGLAKGKEPWERRRLGVHEPIHDPLPSRSDALDDLLGHGAGDAVVADVDALAVGERVDPLDEVFFAGGDDRVRARVGQDLGLLARARRGDDAHAGCLCDAYGCQSCRARRGCQEQRLEGLQRHQLKESVVVCEVDHAEACALDVVEAGGRLHEGMLGQDGEFREGAVVGAGACGQRVDPVADLEAAHAFADGFDRAADVVSEL